MNTENEEEKRVSFIQHALKIYARKNSGPTTCNSSSTPVTSWIEANPLVVHPFSARKLASVVWEFQQFCCPVTTGDTTLFSGVDNHHHDHHPATAGSLRRDVEGSLTRHCQSTERNKHEVRPLSPASYSSSLEMAPYDPAATPDNSIEMRRRIGSSSYRFKTSAELLKVLNHIWRLEQQNVSSTILVKGLKTELVHARARIKQLLKDQRANRREIDQLVKKISEDSLARMSKDHESIDAALQSVKNELEDERKLRKRSESLHRNLARELFEVKVALATSVKEYDKENKSSELLEKLCDEFAKGIQEFARELHTAKQNPNKDWTGTTDQDSMILQMTESWLDERAQIEHRETQGIGTQRQPVIDKLRPEIESFLADRQVVDVKTKGIDTRLRRYSLESIPEAVTAPKNSAFSDLHGAGVSKAGPSRYGEQEELTLRERKRGQTPPSVNKFDSQDTPCNVDHGITKSSEGTSAEINMLEKSDIYDFVEEQRKKAYDEEGHGSNSKTVDKLMSELLLSEGGSAPPEYKEVDSSNPVIRRNASPTRQWVASMASPDTRISEGSSRTLYMKDNTLKAKSQESKSKGQRPRTKIRKGLS